MGMPDNKYSNSNHPSPIHTERERMVKKDTIKGEKKKRNVEGKERNSAQVETTFFTTKKPLASRPIKGKEGGGKKGKERKKGVGGGGKKKLIFILTESVTFPSLSNKTMNQ